MCVKVHVFMLNGKHSISGSKVKGADKTRPLSFSCHQKGLNILNSENSMIVFYEKINNLQRSIT